MRSTSSAARHEEGPDAALLLQAPRRRVRAQAAARRGERREGRGSVRNPGAILIMLEQEALERAGFSNFIQQNTFEGFALINILFIHKMSTFF